MGKAPSTLAAAVMLAVFLCWGNAAAESCNDCWCTSDTTCTDTPCGNSPTANCSRKEQVAACTGTYSIRVETMCSNENDCGGCQTCATVWKLDGGNEYLLANCHDNRCGESDCAETCDVDLSEGDTYV